MDLPQEVSNAIYSVLFKVAPFLAGGQERRRQKAFSVANEQTVDEAAGTVDNRVSLTFNKQKIDIRVFGAAREQTDDADTLEICFEGFELGGLPTILCRDPWDPSSRPSSTTTCACRAGVGEDSSY